MRKMPAIIAVLVGLFAQDAGAQDLHLMCVGFGTANKATVSNGYASNSYGESATATVVRPRSVGFEDQVNIDIAGGVGRIRIPRTMLPPIHGGDDGWFELKKLKMTDQEITASAEINFISSPKIRIDRTTGRVLIDGKAGTFSGECEPYDPATVRKKF